ncbi:hypothetical protein L0222_01915 [bacterium]|nr:hypothetical protein [bacterium]MCI0604715.1 hypothetical protein [bacterium]
MKKRFWIALVPLLFVAATYQSRFVNHTLKFDNPAVTDLLSPISGAWEVVTPPKINQPVLSQSVKYADYPKVLMKDRDYFDFEVSTKIYISSENQDTQAGGLILRYRNLYSFYMLFLNSKDQRLTLTRASRGGIKVLERVNHAFTPDRWYELKAVCYLDRLKAYVDGQLIIDAEDEVSTGGKVGLVTAGTSLVYFESLQVKSEVFEVVAGK